MKLGDPFSRVEKRTEVHYRMFRESMETAAVKTERDLALVVRRIRGKLGIALAAVVSVNLSGLLFFPAFAPVVAVLSAVFLVWLSATALRIRGFVRRYRRELV